MAPDPDAELMLAVKQGDERSFALLFDRYARAIVNFAYRYVGERGRAEELAQDIFLKVFKSAPAWEPKAKVKTWLFRIAANHCLNELRRGRYRSEHASLDAKADDDAPARQLASPEAGRPDAALEGRDLEKALGEALAALPERERAAFTLCRFEGMAYKDIAEALGATEAAVKSLIHRASVAVARRLEPVTAGTATAAQAKGS